MSDFIQVTTTTAEKADAERIAAELVRRRLAACVQVSGPITSVYRWKGQIETSREWLCTAKTARRRYESVEKAIRQLHPYEVPEIVATEIVAASQSYLDWLRDHVRGEVSDG